MKNLLKDKYRSLNSECRKWHDLALQHSTAPGDFHAQAAEGFVSTTEKEFTEDDNDDDYWRATAVVATWSGYDWVKNRSYSDIQRKNEHYEGSFVIDDVFSESTQL
jgi:hypothetical protein